MFLVAREFVENCERRLWRAHPAPWRASDCCVFESNSAQIGGKRKWKNIIAVRARCPGAQRASSFLLECLCLHLVPLFTFSQVVMIFPHRGRSLLFLLRSRVALTWTADERARADLAEDAVLRCCKRTVVLLDRSRTLATPELSVTCCRRCAVLYSLLLPAAMQALRSAIIQSSTVGKCLENSKRPPLLVTDCKLPGKIYRTSHVVSLVVKDADFKWDGK